MGPRQGLDACFAIYHEPSREWSCWSWGSHVRVDAVFGFLTVLPPVCVDGTGSRRDIAHVCFCFRSRSWLLSEKLNFDAREMVMRIWR
eukprot:CCRYP_019529-RA/>CCRYP_019529-RA protein AED:0.28 eAED:0.35 QI:0/-1/0/1/-1/0/1/0/87